MMTTTPRERLAAAFMHEGTFGDLQANDDWGNSAARLALSVLADIAEEEDMPVTACWLRVLAEDAE